MAKTATVNGQKVRVYGPFEGSAKNHGRKHYTYYNPKTGKRGSIDAARLNYESKHGDLPKGKEVDHKNSNNKDDRASNLQVMSKSANVAKEDRRRAKKKK